MPAVVPGLAGGNSSPTTPAQPSAPWLTDIPVSLSTQIPSVRKPICNTLLVIPQTDPFDHFCCHSGLVQARVTSILVAMAASWCFSFASHGVFLSQQLQASSHTWGTVCLRCCSLHLEQSPGLGVAFEVPHGLPLCLQLSFLSPSCPPLLLGAGPGPRPRVAGGSCWRSIISKLI